MALSLCHSTLRRALPRELLVACSISISQRPFSVLNRPPPNYSGHVPLTKVERAGLAVGSAVMSLINPYRAGIYTHCIPRIFADGCGRLDSSSWRSYSNTVLHLPLKRRHVSLPHRPADPSRPSTDDIPDTIYAISPCLAWKYCRTSICRLVGQRRGVARYAR